jgi:hypothetical protein
VIRKNKGVVEVARGECDVPHDAIVGFRPCLVPSKFQKIYKISYHIESLDACMEH